MRIVYLGVTSCQTNLPTFSKKPRLFILCVVFMLMGLSPQKTLALTPQLSLSYGTGEPDHLEGYRIALQSSWPWAGFGFAQSPINLRGYWDFSVAHWKVVPIANNQSNTMTIFSASPLVRLTTGKCFLAGQPYMEFGIGASLLPHNHLGHRNLGGQFAFQDLIGLGLRWRTVLAWSVSYHYLHYSNAGLLPPNQGIDVKHLVSVSYEFD